MMRRRKTGRIIFIFTFMIMALSACSKADMSGIKGEEASSDQSSIIISEADPLQPEASSAFTEKYIETEQLNKFSYWLYTPTDAKEGMPLIIYLHGAGGRGDDPDQILSEEDFPMFLSQGYFGNLRAYVLIPQLPADMRSWGDISGSIYTLIEQTVSDLLIDTENISLAGFSMGGTAVWELAAIYPDLFSRIAPIAGSARGVLNKVQTLREMPVHAFVSSDDTVIAPNSSEQMIAELRKAGADAQITVLEGTEHISIPSVIFNDESVGLIDWLVGTADSEADGMNMYANSDFIEKEQPELSEETKELISAYQNAPTEENYEKLRERVIADYDAVVARKEEKLKELKTETAGKPGGEAIVSEMEELVQEIHDTYWERIDSSMLRFTDPRLLDWKIADAPYYEYIPVMGAGENIYIKRTPVTNKEYAEFLNATGYPAPSNWQDGTFLAEDADLPVNFVSYEDAVSYCNWLTEQDGVNIYRLPSESEWELAAGHMPKDADFNCGVNDGRTPVGEYADVTRGAHGAVDFWGNVWEWTSTVRYEKEGATILGVKGGSWRSERTDCRTEYREEGRDASQGYDDVGFRVILVKS